MAVEPVLDGALTADDAPPQSDHLCPFDPCCLPTSRASRRVGRAQGLAGDHGTIAVGAEVKSLLFKPPLSFRLRHGKYQNAGRFPSQGKNGVGFINRWLNGRMLFPLVFLIYPIFSRACKRIQKIQGFGERFIKTTPFLPGKVFTRFGCRTIWLSGYLAIWLSGYLAIWLSGYLAIWLSGGVHGGEGLLQNLILGVEWIM